MKIEKIHPDRLMPTDPPYKIGTIDSLCKEYKKYELLDPNIPSDQRELLGLEEEGLITLDSQLRIVTLDYIPFVFVHHSREEKKTFIVDGNHRTGIARMYGCHVNVIHLSSFRDLSAAATLADMGLIPSFDFELEIKSKICSLSRIAQAYWGFAYPAGARTFNDYVDNIKIGMFGLAP